MFFTAGSDIIETNSYQASIPGFMKYLNLSFEESVALLQESVNLAKQAIEEEKKVNPTIGNGNSYSATFKFLIRPTLLFTSSIAL